MLVSPSPGCMTPLSSVADSIVRQLVVPTQIMRAARLFCLIDLIRCFLRNTIKFRMHMMLFHIINLDRAECSQSDMQCHARDRYTHLFDLLQ